MTFGATYDFPRKNSLFARPVDMGKLRRRKISEEIVVIQRPRFLN